MKPSQYICPAWDVSFFASLEARYDPPSLSPVAIAGRSSEAVAQELEGKPIGDGVVHRVCVDTQRKFFDPPNLARGTGISKYRCRA